MSVVRLIIIVYISFFISIFEIDAQVKDIKKGDIVARFSLKLNADSTIFNLGSSDNKYSDKFFNYSFYNGNLIDGISNLIGVPRNCLIINRLPLKLNFINYDIYMYNEFDYISTKKNMIQFLENEYSFKLKETNMWFIFDSWKFIVSDSSKLPKSKVVYISTVNEGNNLRQGQNSTLLINDTIQMVSGNFNEVLKFAEIVSGYYCDNENIGIVDMNIPMDVFKDIDSAKKFFNPYGIDVIWSKRDAKVNYLTFFDE